MGEGVPEIFRVGKSLALPVSEGRPGRAPSIAWDKGPGEARWSSAGPQKVTRGATNGACGTKRRAAPQGRPAAAPYGAKAKQRGRAAPGA